VPAANQVLAEFANHSVPLLTDLERDGDLDLLLGASSTARTRWLRNEAGLPHRTIEPHLPEIESPMGPLAIGDVDGDGDGDLDMLLAGNGGQCFRNDGHGAFAPVAAGAFTQVGWMGSSLQLADFDGDGDVDAAVGVSSPATIDFFWNQGGAFTRQSLPFAAGYQITAGDVDGDGDVDVYGSPYSGSDQVLENLGGGTFAVAAGAVPAGIRLEHPRLVDLDNDGHLDVVGCTG
jgi:hypothetical protein